MDIRRLRYFVAVAETLSFTAAARQLGMAQPPLSVQIRRLEEEIGSRLFDRANRRTILTPAGRHLLTRARQILDLAGTTRNELEDAAAGRAGTLNIGVSDPSFAAQPIRILRKFVRKHRGVRLQVKNGDSASLQARLRTGEIDAAYGIADPAWPFRRLALCVTRLIIAVGKRHRLQDRSSLALADLVGERILVDGRADSDPAGTAFSALSGNPAIPPNIDRSSGDLNERLWQAAIGLCVTPCLEIETERLASSLRAIPLKEISTEFPVYCYASPESQAPALELLLHFIEANEDPS